MSQSARTEAEKGATTQQVLEAVQDLHSQQQIVTRETLAAVTGLKLMIVDDRLKVLVAREQVARVERGVFVPVTQHPAARLISKMVLPDGTVKIDIGDDVTLTLTPRENRLLGELMAGAGNQLAAIELGNQAALLNAQLSGKVHRLERQLQALHARVDPDQMPLALG